MAVVLLCTTASSFAQGRQDRPGRNDGDQSERAAPRSDRSSVRQERAAPQRVERARRESTDGDRRAGRDQADKSRAVERRRANEAASERRRAESNDDQRRAQQQERARERAQRGDDNRRRAQQEERSRERAQRGDDNRRRAQQEERSRERAQKEERSRERAQRGDGAEQKAERREAAREARTRLSQEQRGRFHKAFDRRRAAKAKFHVGIGAHVPRSVRLYAIPTVVLGLVPAYRDYRYVYIDDVICIVDPVSYEIVDVIEYSSGGPGPIDAQLELSPSERALILDYIAADFPEPGVDLRLAFGAEVPGRVELHSFPDALLDDIPKLRPYRFVVSDGDVVIVDPRDREIEVVVLR
jgi:hypothetical protein